MAKDSDGCQISSTDKLLIRSCDSSTTTTIDTETNNFDNLHCLTCVCHDTRLLDCYSVFVCEAHISLSNNACLRVVNDIVIPLSCWFFLNDVLTLLWFMHEILKFEIPAPISHPFQINPHPYGTNDVLDD